MVKMKNQTQPPAAEGIDFEAALPSQQNDDDLKVAMRTLRSGKPIPTSYPIKEKPAKPARRPKGKKAKPKGAKRQPLAQPKTPNSPYIDNNTLINNNVIRGIDINEIDHIAGQPGESAAAYLKSKMTAKELKFLSSYLSGGVTVIQAMDSAGYGNFHQDTRYQLARKIIQKYETQAPDHRIIFRAMGAGEVAVVEGLLKLAQGAKSEMVRLNAWAMIAKCIGLTKDQIEGQAGITIIFEGAAPTLPAALALPPQAGEQPQPVTYQAPNRVLQITK